MEKWPVFICYRQSDGKEVARRVFRLLNEHRISIHQPKNSKFSTAIYTLDVYFDKVAPSVNDWTLIHEPYLKRSRALIIICTPGVKIYEGPDDWVYKEINWWLEHRDTSPIIVDALGQGTRYIPNIILETWPNVQRTEIIEKIWTELEDDKVSILEKEVREQLIGGIGPSAENIYQQELRIEQTRRAELELLLHKQKKQSRHLGFSLIVIICIGIFAAFSKLEIIEQKSIAEQTKIKLLMEKEKAESERKRRDKEKILALKEKEYSDLLQNTINFYHQGEFQLAPDEIIDKERENFYSEGPGDDAVYAVRRINIKSNEFEQDSLGLEELTKKKILFHWGVNGISPPEMGRNCYSTTIGNLTQSMETKLFGLKAILFMAQQITKHFRDLGFYGRYVLPSFFEIDPDNYRDLRKEMNKDLEILIFTTYVSELRTVILDHGFQIGNDDPVINNPHFNYIVENSPLKTGQIEKTKFEVLRLNILEDYVRDLNNSSDINIDLAITLTTDVPFEVQVSFLIHRKKDHITSLKNNENLNDRMNTMRQVGIYSRRISEDEEQRKTINKFYTFIDSTLR